MAAPVISPIYASQVVSGDVVTALTLYQESFLNALRGYAPPEMVEIGLQDTTSALAYKLPLSVGSSAWQLVTGGVVYDKVGEIMLPISMPPYGQAVCAEVAKIQSDAWTGWGERPAESAFNAANIGERALAVALESGETSLSVENFLDGVVVPASSVYIFQKDHPYSPLDIGETSVTWSNLFTGNSSSEFDAAPLNLDSIDRVASAAEHQIGMNGVDFYPLEWKWVVVPPQLKRKALRYFADQGSRNDQIIETSGTSTAQVRKDNHAKDLGVTVLVNRYLTSATTWYPVFTASASRRAPWVTVTQRPAHPIPFSGGNGTSGSQTPNMDGQDIEWLIDDLSSKAYKHGDKEAGIPKGNVGIQGVRRVGAGIVNPRQLFKCKAT